MADVLKDKPILSVRACEQKQHHKILVIKHCKINIKVLFEPFVWFISSWGGGDARPPSPFLSSTPLGSRGRMELIFAYAERPTSPPPRANNQSPELAFSIKSFNYFEIEKKCEKTFLLYC